MNMKEKLVLAYSGGLDTSVSIKWLSDAGYDMANLFILSGCCKRTFLKNIVRNSCFFHFFVDFLLTRLAFTGIILNGIVCPTRAPETQVYVKHSNRIGGK